MAVPYTFGNATTSIPLSQLDSNFATAITIGNTAVYLGNTTTSFGNVTLNNVTIASGNATVTKITAPTHDAGSGNALTLQSNSTTAIYVDTSQNVGIGTTSPTQKLDVYAASGVSAITARNAGTTSSDAGWLIAQGGSYISYIRQQGDGNSFLVAPSNWAIYTNNAERMRIDSSGNLLVGTTSTVQSALLSALSSASTAGFRTSASAGSGICIDVSRTSATGDMVYFRTSSTTLAGYITCPTGTTTNYTSVSDYRLKENVTPITTGLSTIAALKPVNYDWISDKSAGEGFIAHELQTVIPHAVSGEKDAVNEDGSIKPQGVDYSKIVVHLVAALQELDAKFEAYKASHP